MNNPKQSSTNRGMLEIAKAGSTILAKFWKCGAFCFIVHDEQVAYDEFLTLPPGQSSSWRINTVKKKKKKPAFFFFFRIEKV